MGHAREAVEVAKTVVEVADLAWSAIEHLHHHHHENPNPNPNPDNPAEDNLCPYAEELEDLRKENQRLRELLEQNLKLLNKIEASPCLVNNCPADLHERIVAAVDSKNFLTRLQSLRDSSVKTEFPFKEPTGADLDFAEVLINVNQEEPSWWVWVTDEMVPGTIEERSGIDDENYVIVCEEQVVDGVANFIARCIVSNPKVQKLTPEQLQKTVTKSLGGITKVEKMLDIWHAGMMFYTLSTWGLALVGLYKSRAVLRLAAHGVHSTSKLVLKAL